MNILANELSRFYEPVDPFDFYRDVFPEGELDVQRDEPAKSTEHKYVGIIIQVTGKKKKDGKPLVYRYTLTDELDAIDLAINSKDFCVLAPISYIGNARKSEHARIMYGLVVELDNLVVGKHGEQAGLRDLMHQWGDDVRYIPRPTYTVASGSGLHLYYLFEKGIPLFANVVKGLKAYKKRLTELVWNRYTTTSYKHEDIQFESVFQAFRMVGTVTKKGDRVYAFRTGERVSIDYMNSFITSGYLKRHPNAQIPVVYQSSLTLAEAREKYPEWYQRRIVEGRPRGRWITNRALYDNWKIRLYDEAQVGHRYYCLMSLCIDAIKCDIPYDELERDCFELAERYEELTVSEDNHFTTKDVLDALQCFEDKSLVTYPASAIMYRTGITIEKAKHNGRKQADHLRRVRAMQDSDYPNHEWAGRPSKSHVVAQWREDHPDGKKADCIRDTGLSKPTVYRWWDLHNSVIKK